MTLLAISFSSVTFAMYTTGHVKFSAVPLGTEPVPVNPHLAVRQVESGVVGGADTHPGKTAVALDVIGAFFWYAGEAYITGKYDVPKPPRSTVPWPKVAANPRRGWKSCH